MASRIGARSGGRRIAISFVAPFDPRPVLSPRTQFFGGPMIRAGIPKNWVLGDKTGRGSNGATNDIAILRPPDRAPILLAIYFIGSTTPAKDREAAIAEVAKIVAESFVSAVQNTAPATSDYQRALH